MPRSTVSATAHLRRTQWGGAGGCARRPGGWRDGPRALPHVEGLQEVVHREPPARAVDLHEVDDELALAAVDEEGEREKERELVRLHDRVARQLRHEAHGQLVGEEADGLVPVGRPVRVARRLAEDGRAPPGAATPLRGLRVAAHAALARCS